MAKEKRRFGLCGCSGPVLLALGIFLILGIFGNGVALWIYLEYQFLTAKEIRVVEHSTLGTDRVWLQHWQDPEWAKHPQPYKETIFKSTALDSSQRHQLERSVFPLPNLGLGAVKCFEPHHRIEVVHGDGTITTVEICFHCGNYAIGDEEDRTLPWGWDSSLADFVTSLGMRPYGPFE